MKNITKDNKGITLISLIITIILMLILTSVTVYTGLDTYKFSKVNAFVTEMQLIQAKVDELVEMRNIEELGSEVTSNSAINSAYLNNEILSNNISEYRYFTKEDLLEILDIDDARGAVMINFSTREVVSANGVEYEGKRYYTQYKLPGGQKLINSTNTTQRNTSFAATKSIKGLNATITIDDIKITNGTLKYKEQADDYWKTITNHTETSKTYETIISKTGTYTFKLQDNTNDENYTDTTIVIVTTNVPKTKMQIEPYDYALASEDWAYATDADGNNYVWIPRFAYKTNDIKYIKGNSNIATDNEYIDDSWEIYQKFTTDEGIELTGIWISVEYKKQTNLDMITLIEDSSKKTLIEI